MLKIKIVTDSASDIPLEKEKELDIKIIPFPIVVDDVDYIERKDFNFEQFYEILNNAKKIPTTSQITTNRFIDEFYQIAKQGYTDIIYISINSKGSNTYNSAIMAKETFFDEYPEYKGKYNIHIVDSLTYSFGYGYAVIEAAKKAQKGCTIQEILSYLEDWFASLEIYFAPYSLEFARKSGRISCAAAFVGEIMGLKPIITFIDGESKIIQKVRGDKKIIPTILDIANQNRIPETPFFILKGSVNEYAEEMLKESSKIMGNNCIGVFNIGAAITINSGHNLIGIAIKGKRRI